MVVGSPVAGALGDDTAADVAEISGADVVAGEGGNDGEQAARTRPIKPAREDPSNRARIVASGHPRYSKCW